MVCVQICIHNTRDFMSTSIGEVYAILVLAMLTNGCFIACPLTEQTSSMVELKTDLPPIRNSPTGKSRTLGNRRCQPPRIMEPNVEELREVPHLKVPIGASNLARGKPVTASDEEPLIGSLNLITDGNKKLADDSYVELMPGLQWIQVDLQIQTAIYAVWVWHDYTGWPNGWKSCYLDVIVQISDEPTFTGKVATIFNNDYDNSAGKGIGKDRPYIETNLGKLIPVQPPTKGRYVRLYSSGNCWGVVPGSSRYVEVEVFGVASRLHTGIQQDGEPGNASVKNTR